MSRRHLVAAVLVVPLVVAGGLGSFPPAEEASAGPAFLAISVSDIDATLRWYRRAFPALTEHRLPMPDSIGRGALLESPELRVEILAMRAAAPPARPRDETYLTHGIFKAGFSVPALAPYLDRFAQQGVRVTAGPFVDSTTGTRSVVIADNEGNLLHLFEPLR